MAAQPLDIAYLNAVVQDVLRQGGWTVVVFPTRATAVEGVKALAGLLPAGAVGCGRTSLLPNAGKVSVVSADDTPFTTLYRVEFVGWSGVPGKEYLGMAAWRVKARGG